MSSDFTLPTLSKSPPVGTGLLLDDAFTQEELCRVHEDPGDVADDEDHHDADENQGKVHLVVDAGVGTVRSSMCVSLNEEYDMYVPFVWCL